MSEADNPLGYASKIEALMKLPQSLCKQCGWSCRMATFKGLMNVSDMQSVLQNEQASLQEKQQIQAFLTLFKPYDSQEQVKALAPVFLEKIREVAIRKGTDPEQVSFFSCRFLQEDSRCGIYEDRPQGCRQYPIVHPNTIFHPGCGFEEQSKQNWVQIEKILDMLGLDSSGRPKSL